MKSKKQIQSEEDVIFRVPITITSAVPEHRTTSSHETSKGHIQRIPASSERLIKASPYFRAMLTGGTAEAVTFKKDGVVAISLPEEDAETIDLLMNILHERFMIVPKQLPLATLSKVSLAVEKYQLRHSKAARLIASIWLHEKFDHISNLPDLDGAEMLEWIDISWTFRHSETFELATKQFIARATKSLDVNLCLDRPVSQTILRRINVGRALALWDALVIVRLWVQELSGWSFFCPFQDDPSMAVECGKLTHKKFARYCQEYGLYPPAIEIPYTDCSVEALLREIRFIMGQSMCKHAKGRLPNFSLDLYEDCKKATDRYGFLPIEELENPKEHMRLGSDLRPSTL